MLKLQNEVNNMFERLGLNFTMEENPYGLSLEEAMQNAFVEAMTMEVEEYKHNEVVFNELHELIIDGKANEKQQAQYTFLNENFSMDPTEYIFGSLNPRNDQEDEKFDPLDKFHVRFGQEELPEYFDQNKGVGVTNSYEDVKWWIATVQEREFKPKKERIGIKKHLLTTNEKFSLFSTTGTGEVWIPNEMAEDDRWMLDAVDQEMATWDKHIKKIKLF